MIVFAITVAYLVIMYLLCEKAGLKNKKKVFCVSAFIVLVLVMGLRSRYTAGVDTNLVYIPSFFRICRLPLSTIADVYIKDTMFYIMTKLFTIVSENVQLYLLCISVFVVGVFCRFVYKYSDNPLLSYIVYMALGYYGIGFQMLRHIIAASILLISYDYLRDRKFIRFLLLVLLASCFHITAFVFIVAYPIYVWKVGVKQIGLIVAAVIMGYFFRGVVLSILQSVLSNQERFSMYFMTDHTVLAVTGFFILLIVYVVSWLMIPKAERNELDIRGMFNLSMIATIAMFMVSIIGEFHRISMYFGFYNTLLLPSACKRYKGTKKEIISILIGVVMVAYFLAFQLENQGLSDYRFFWND